MLLSLTKKNGIFTFHSSLWLYTSIFTLHPQDLACINFAIALFFVKCIHSLPETKFKMFTTPLNLCGFLYVCSAYQCQALSILAGSTGMQILLYYTVTSHESTLNKSMAIHKA